jgi:hypothetical protein
MIRKVLFLAFVGGFGLAVAACGSGTPATSELPPANSAPPDGENVGAPPTSAPVQPTVGPAAASSGIDTEAINLCQILPRAELAGLAGGTPYEGAETSGPACIYTIDPGDGTAELYSMSVSAPDLIQPMVDYVRQYEQAEWLEGIGDAAYLQPADFGEGYDVIVLVEGEYGLSLGGPRPEVLQAAARLILERLGE